MATVLDEPLCRDVTPDEIAHYREFGWVKLKAIVQPTVVAELLRRGMEKAGVDGAGGDTELVTTKKTEKSYFNQQDGPGPYDPFGGKLIRNLGRVTKLLLGRKPGIEVRYVSDSFLPKLPSATGAGIKTDFHQDHPHMALDRSSGVNIWIALTDLTPESGTLSFVNGSHRLGTLGVYQTYTDGDALVQFPEILGECTISEPMSYSVGDITVHSHMTVHGTGENLTDKPRWGYNMALVSSDSAWNGAPSGAFNSADMKPFQTLDDERFPVISR